MKKNVTARVLAGVMVAFMVFSVVAAALVYLLG